MPFTKIAVASVVVCLAVAGVAQADQDGRRGRGRGRHGRVAVPRGAIARPPVVVQRHVYPRRVTPYGYGGRLAYRPVYRPGLGIGIYIGSPFRYRYPAYAWPYYARPYPHYGYATPYANYSYGYATPYPYPYPQHSYGIQAAPPPGTLYGGVQLDGYYAGIVDDFDGAWQRVALEPGPHRFEIAAPGLETLTFEVNVRPNQTVRYRGDMMRVVP
jgi:hypothetical protein